MRKIIHTDMHRKRSARIRRPCALATRCIFQADSARSVDRRTRHGDIAAQTRRVFENLKAVCDAAGGSFAQIVRVGIYLTDLANFARSTR